MKNYPKPISNDLDYPTSNAILRLADIDDIILSFHAYYCNDSLEFALRKLDRVAMSNFCMLI